MSSPTTIHSRRYFLSRGEQNRTSFVVSKTGISLSAARLEDGLRTRTAGSLLVFEKHQQLIHRHAPSFIRDGLDRFRQRTLTADPATDPLGISPSRRCALATAYLRARAKKQGLLWLPGRSGGNQAAPGSQPVLNLLGKRLNGSGIHQFDARPPPWCVRRTWS